MRAGAPSRMTRSRIFTSPRSARLTWHPCVLQDAVAVVGYPIGGETISVTTGVVSRIEVTSYSHGATELLGIQIDAAINPGNSGAALHSRQFRRAPYCKACCITCRRRNHQLPAAMACSSEGPADGVSSPKLPYSTESSVLLSAGGPCFNEIGQCVGIAFQSLSHGEADGIGYVIPTPVINHFLTDYR